MPKLKKKQNINEILNVNKGTFDVDAVKMY